MTPTVAAATGAFAAATDPYRPELLAHCYRMLGSIHDAEDLVQETYLRAWRSFDRFEGRSSVRLWLYTIATRACLTALERREWRPLPSGLGAPTEDWRAALAPADPARPWLEPAPDVLFGATGAAVDPAVDPAAVVVARDGVRLAFVAALQELSARQRAVLILRDVLALRAAEAAEVLGTTTTAVNSILRRARSRLGEGGPRADEIAEPVPTQLRGLLDRYVAAFETSDLDALFAVLRADVELEMPPQPTWLSGRDAVAGFFAAHVFGSPGSWRMEPTRANGQPALVVYHRLGDGRYHAHGLSLLTLIGPHVARIVAFNDPALVALAGREPVLAGSARGGR